MKTIFGVLLGLFLTGSASGVDAAPPPQREVQLSIEQQTLVDALNEWAQQTGYQLVSPTSDVTYQIVAPQVKGRFTAQAALEKLLAGTPLTFVWLNERSVAIRAKTNGRNSVTESGQPAGDISESTQELRLAQAPTEEGSTEEPRQEDAPSSHDEAELKLEEVVVTGTNIRGVSSAGSPVLTFTAKDIEQSGYTTTQDFLRSVPQIFGGGDSDDTFFVIGDTGGTSTGPSSGVNGVNLRGLGNQATLVLVDGRRLATGGDKGTSVDVSMIPITAIERIDVLTDGASAIYGSDAVSGVVNFILKRSQDGAETSLRYGNVTQGSRSDATVSQVFGQDWSRGSALLSYQFQRQGALSSADRPQLMTPDAPSDMLPDLTRHSALLRLHQELPRNFEAYGGAQFGRRDSDGATRTNGEVGQYSYHTRDVGVHAGLRKALASNWSFDGYVSYGDSDTDQRTHYVFSDLSVLDSANEFRTKAKDVEIKADGPLFSLPGGTAKIALGVRRSEEDLERVADAIAGDRVIESAFAEVFLPLVSARNQAAGLRELSLSLAVRQDRYSDFGSTANPKFGLSWRVFDFLKVRGSYGTSFRAPTLFQIAEPAVSYGWLSGGVTPTLLLAGGNTELDAEESKTWTVGLDYQPPSVGNLDLALTYYSIEYDNRIAAPSVNPDFFGSPLTNPFFASTIVLGPTLAQLNAAVAGALFYADVSGSDPPLELDDLVAIVDGRNTNFAQTVQSGLDFSAMKNFQAAGADLALSANVAYILKSKDAVAPTDPFISSRNIVFYPAALQAHGGVSWSRAAASANLAINYTGSYRNNRVLPVEEVSSSATFDASAAYAFSGGISVSAGVLNIFDRDPPGIASIDPANNPWHLRYDPTNYDPLGRFVWMSLKKRW